MKKLKVEDLKNTKFIVSTEEESEKVQEHLNRLGIDCDVSYECHLLHLGKELWYNRSLQNFIEYEDKLILVEQILEIEIPKPKIKPGSYVINKIDPQVHGIVRSVDGGCVIFKTLGEAFDDNIEVFRLATPEEISEIVRECNELK